MEPLEIRLTCFGQYTISQCDDLETKGFRLTNIFGEPSGDSSGGNQSFQADLIRSLVMTSVAIKLPVARLEIRR